MDRSKYRNKDAPVGYNAPEAELKYKYGITIDGDHYVLAPFIWSVNIYERPDYDTLSDFDISDDESDAAGCSTITPVSFEKEPDEKNVSGKSSSPKHKKKGHDISELQASVSHINISTKKNFKNTKKVKKEHKDNFSGDNSCLPSSHKHSSSPSSHKIKLVKYSPSPSPSPSPPPERSVAEYLDVKVKEEPLDPPDHLFGSYHCDVCNITMNSLLTYNTHTNGKRHRKNLKARNVSEVVAQSIPASVVSEDQTKYPIPRPGVNRKKVATPAHIQRVIEDKVKTPCPGLNYVTEIQGIEGVQYYCSMCDANCASNSIIPHLTGFKHQLNSVKEFRPGDYNDMNYAPKYKIEKEVLSILRAVQKQYGMGRMAVEIEDLVFDPQDMKTGGKYSSTDYRNQPSTSREMGRKSLGGSFPEIYDNASIPNKSASDFHCEVCDSHMNSQQMWESHVRGKRHLTNLKKMPGDQPSKNKTILVPNRRAHLLDRLQDECPFEPAVGLKEIRETIIHETQSYSYQCFLCGSCHTSLDIVDHVISLKHRMKYLDHINHPTRNVTTGMNDSDTVVTLVRVMCEEVEKEKGRDSPPVYMSRNIMYRQ